MNNDVRAMLFGCITVILIVACIVGGIVYITATSNIRYYQAMNHCIEAGGTFVPQANSNAACIMLDKH